MLDEIRFIATTASLVIAAGCGALLVVKAKKRSLSVHPLVLLLFVVIFVPSFIQVFLWSDLYTYFSRNADLIAGGEVWRLFTAAMVQSGYISGLLFNLTCFVVLVPLSARLLGAKPTLVFFLIGVLAGQVAGLSWLPVGGGNSVGNYGVAAALLAYAIVSGPPTVKLVATVASLSTIMAMVLLDIHGAAYAVTLVCALAYYYVKTKKTTKVNLRTIRVRA